MRERRRRHLKKRRGDADIVFMCVGNDNDVRSVTLGGGGVLSGVKRGAIVVDHTTASADLAAELAREAAERGAGFLDAPVSGGQAGAENGQLTIMVGGDADTFAIAEPVMQHYGRAVTLMGDVGSGQLTKMVNQLCPRGHHPGHFRKACTSRKRAGLDVGQVISVISQGAAQCWQMDNRAETMAKREFDFGFAVKWMRKDLDMTLAAARKYGARLPVAALVDQFYAEVEALGGERWDTSSLVERLRRVDGA